MNVIGATLSIYVIPIVQWATILMNLEIIGVWSICIAFTSVALMVHSSILLVPVLIATYGYMKEHDGFPDREEEKY